MRETTISETTPLYLIDISAMFSCLSRSICFYHCIRILSSGFYQQIHVHNSPLELLRLHVRTKSAVIKIKCRNPISALSKQRIKPQYYSYYNPDISYGYLWTLSSMNVWNTVNHCPIDNCFNSWFINRYFPATCTDTSSCFVKCMFRWLNSANSPVEAIDVDIDLIHWSQ